MIIVVLLVRDKRFVCEINYSNKQSNWLTDWLTNSLTHSLTHSLTPWSWVLPAKLTGPQVVKNFPALDGTRRFITAFTTARQSSLSWVRWIQFTSSCPISWRLISMLSPHLHLGLPLDLFPSGFPTKTLYEALLTPTRATCPAHPILLDLVYWRTVITPAVYQELISDV